MLCVCAVCMRLCVFSCALQCVYVDMTALPLIVIRTLCTWMCHGVYCEHSVCHTGHGIGIR